MFSGKNCRTQEELLASPKLFSKLIYSSLEEAIYLLEARRQDDELKRKIASYIGCALPECLLETPRALLFRQVATPNFETLRFFHNLSGKKIAPLILEYSNDKFTSRNPLKHALGKLRFIDVDMRGQIRIQKETILDFNTNEGRKIAEVNTVWGQSLIDFHHKFFKSALAVNGDFSFDASGWFSKAGGVACNYYSKYLTLFLQNAVLFENFVLTDNEERKFIASVFLPSYFEIFEIFGIKPIIVPLLSLEDESSREWTFYPIRFQPFILSQKVLK